MAELEITTIAAIVGVIISLAGLLITYYRWVHIPLSEKRKKERLKAKKALEQKISNLDSMIGQLTKSINECVRTNKFGTGANVGWYEAEFKGRVQEYHKMYDKCRDWLEAVRLVVSHRLEVLAKKGFPKTSNPSNISQSFESEEFINRFIDEESITSTWIKENYPSFYKTLLGTIEDTEKEHSLDEFLLEANKNPLCKNVLKTFRMEKDDIAKFGNQLIEDMKRRKEVLEKELSKYSNLEEVYPDL